MSKDVLEIVSGETISQELKSLDSQVIQQWGEFQQNVKMTEDSRKRLADSLRQMHDKLSNHGDGTWRKYLKQRKISPATAWRLITTKKSKEPETSEERRRRLRDEAFNAVNYCTAGMTEKETVEELKQLVKKILPMAVVTIELPSENRKAA